VQNVLMLEVEVNEQFGSVEEYRRRLKHLLQSHGFRFAFIGTRTMEELREPSSTAGV
jgi:hypothetical protein